MDLFFLQRTALTTIAYFILNQLVGQCGMMSGGDERRWGTVEGGGWSVSDEGLWGLSMVGDERWWGMRGGEG